MNEQIDLDFSRSSFSGSDYDKRLDQKRLSKELLKVKNIMKDGKWRTKYQIFEQSGCNDFDTCGRMRRRLKEIPDYTVERRRVGKGGTYEYRFVKILEDMPYWLK